jgi:hypothetical protein
MTSPFTDGKTLQDEIARQTVILNDFRRSKTPDAAEAIEELKRKLSDMKRELALLKASDAGGQAKEAGGKKRERLLLKTGKVCSVPPSLPFL